MQPEPDTTAAESESPAAPTDRGAVLLEAANMLACLGPADSLVSAPHAWTEAVGLLRRMAAETGSAGGHQPRRGDRFEAWLKRQRNVSTSWSAWRELDSLLDQYRLHADASTPLGEHVCEGQAVGDCGCLEWPDTAGGTEDPAGLLRRAAALVRERAAVMLPGAGAGVGVGAALADWLEQAADALDGQDTPADEPAVRLARALLAGEAAR